MNREIKFRGRDTFKSDYFPAKWWYGGIMIDGDDAWLCVKTEKKGVVSVKVDRDTIGQYTGIKDKNNTEIWEGDIVRFYYKNCPWMNHIAYVFYDKGEWMSQSANKRCNPCCIFPGNKAEIYEIEVIGNIFDNPELLKGGNK